MPLFSSRLPFLGLIFLCLRVFAAEETFLLVNGMTDEVIAE
jgi:hypothetical protein